MHQHEQQQGHQHHQLQQRLKEQHIHQQQQYQQQHKQYIHNQKQHQRMQQPQQQQQLHQQLNHQYQKQHQLVQSFCSVFVQNVNVISSSNCKVLCFKKHRISPIKCFMLETSPFTVAPSTKLLSSSILSPPSPSLSSLSSSSSVSTSPSSSLSSSSSSSPLSLNPPSPSSSSVSFYISLTSEARVSPSYLNSSVFFLTTCFLLFTGFRCNILLTNIYIDLLLLELVFLKNFGTFNKRYSKFIMCYNFNYRLVLDLYIIFQSF